SPRSSGTRGWSVEWARSPQPNLPFDRIDQRHGIEANALLEYELHFADIRDGGGRVAVDDNQIGLLAGGESADAIVASKILRAVERADRYGLERCESGLDEELELPLVRVAGDHAAAASGVGSRHHQPPRLDERALGRECLGE